MVTLPLLVFSTNIVTFSTDRMLKFFSLFDLLRHGFSRALGASAPLWGSGAPGAHVGAVLLCYSVLIVSHSLRLDERNRLRYPTPSPSSSFFNFLKILPSRAMSSTLV